MLIDLGDSVNIHPRNKKDVGARLSALALAGTYGHKIVGSGPVYQSMKIDGDKIRLTFSGAGGGLVAKPLPETYSVDSETGAKAPIVRNSSSELEGFAICGEDRKWTWADAKIQGGEVVVSSAQVPSPVAVRYAWSSNPTCNLYMSRASRLALPHGRFPDHHSVRQILSSGSTPILPMKNQSVRVIFPSPGLTALEEFPMPVISRPTDVLIENEYSIVSAGTELACRAGLESWAPLPFSPGYGSVGRVVAFGDEVKNLSVGQRVLSFGRHAKHILGEFVVVPVPDGLDPVKVTFARMAAVSMAASRASDAELGDFVAVIGLGLVGNLSAQLFGLAGCEVIGIDPSARRREQALACGVPHVIAPGRR